jgi:hypothetical protein
VAVIPEQDLDPTQIAGKRIGALLHILQVPDLDPKSGCPDRILAQIPLLPSAISCCYIRRQKTVTSFSLFPVNHPLIAVFLDSISAHQTW